MKKLGTIYKIINSANGKVYIGQSVGNGSRRKTSHRSMLRNGKHTNDHLQNAFNKYGEDNFSFEVFLRCPIEKLDEIEIGMIAEHKKIGNCYNIEDGGGTPKGIDEYTRKKLRLALQKLHREDKEFRKRYLETHAKTIICLNDMTIYQSINEAGETLGISADAIGQVLYGKNNYAKGNDGILYQFDYYKEGMKYQAKEVEENPYFVKRKVVCVNTEEVFNSIEDASLAYNVNQSKISMCCRRIRNHAGKLENGSWIVWRYLDEYDDKEKVDFTRKGEFSNRGRPIRCITTGEYFHTLTEAGDKYSLSIGNLSSHIKGNRKSCGSLEDGTKLKWEYA